MKIALAPEAVEDLAAAVAYVHARNPEAAAAMADRVFTAMDRLAAGEFDGPESELRRTGERVRSWPVRPYRLYCRREDDTVILLRLHRAARRPIAR